MSRYLRPRRPGATIYFTVALAARGAETLTHEVEALRHAVRMTRADRPFDIDAWVVLPDHLHCIWTLPKGDSDYSTRWGAIKARFSRALPEGHMRSSHMIRREKAIWQRRYWDEALKTVRGTVFKAERAKRIYGTRTTSPPISSIAGTTRSNTASSTTRCTGPIPHTTATTRPHRLRRRVRCRVRFSAPPGAGV